MRVVKPVQVLDNNLLTASSIAEPDLLSGEIEWKKRTEIIPAARKIYRMALDKSTSTIYASSPLGHIISAMNVSFESIPLSPGSIVDSFSTEGETADITGIAVIDSFIYVLSEYSIYKYTTTGGYTGTSFTVPDQSGKLPICLGVDGDRLVISYELGANPATLSFVDVNGNAEAPFVMYLGENTRVNGIEESERGLYLFNSDESTGDQQMLNVSTDFSVDEGAYIIALDPDNHFAYDIIIMDGLFYSGTPSNSAVWQLNEVGVGVDGYPAGFRAIDTGTHKVYESAAQTTDSPTDGVELKVPSWVEVSATNKYAAFDDSISTTSVGSSGESWTITPGESIDSIAAIDLVGCTSINITMTDPINGEVYNETTSLSDGSSRTNWYDWITKPFSNKSLFITTDLPSYSSASITVTLFGSGSLSVGVITTGKSIGIGNLTLGSGSDILDYSYYDEDSFGNLKVTKRPTAEMTTFNVAVDSTSELEYAYNQLKELTGTLALYIGDEDNSENLTTAYGFHKNLSVRRTSRTINKYSFDVRGIV